MSTASQRGFSLLETMIGVVVAGITVVAAAQIGSSVIQANHARELESDTLMRTGFLSEQLRADIKLAGLGSTGAIAVDPNTPMLSNLTIPTVGGTPALPAIVALNNQPNEAFPFAELRSGTDVLQMVVPNPGTASRTNARSQDGTNVLSFDASRVPRDCDLVYIHDHSNPNGAGRTQVAWVQNADPNAVSLFASVLQFPVASGAEVSCARVSLYWVDTDNYLHRTDVRRDGMIQVGGGAPAPLGMAVAINPVDDIVSPGVGFMQLSFRLSEEAFRIAGVGVPADPSQFWIFQQAGTPLNPFMITNPELWFEVRAVRVSLLMANRQQGIRQLGGNVGGLQIEDGDPGILPRDLGSEWMVTEEVVMNLKMFDQVTAAEVPAEPY